MTRLVLLVLLVILALTLSSTATLAETNLQFNMIGLQAPKDPDVDGLRFVILYGENKRVGGFDLGLAAISDVETRSGLQINMGLSRVDGASSGCAASLINVHGGVDTGVNAAFINVVKTMDSGANVGFVNVSDGFSRVDIGGLSISKKSQTQLGFVNITKEIQGVQIGFLNFAENGFFPMFPFFNFPK